ncbi:Synembryn-like protein C3E7.04c [Lasiodiplodia hormozganensis]|uniref:Synembryn-like protein C3E7.04c n=1 Tax=Lasiodiplodia hormozganensis TaxID=869390 RepID=A0AA39YU32_9PEZI|nr:Synembryn-like protein C3E7.04c [Lasiodiplodia hormozganensis]
MASNSNGAYAASIAGDNKRAEVSMLMAQLRADLDDSSLLPHQRNAALEQIKIYGRDVRDADPIFTPDGIDTLAQHGFYSSSTVTSREAMRCLANALLLQPQCRQILVDKGHAEKVAEKLKSDNADDEFLTSRILFLLTYDTNLDFDPLVREKGLGDAITQSIYRHSKRYSKNGKKQNSSPMDDMALSETLKLVFNLTHFYPDFTDIFSKSVPDLLKILSRAPVPDPPLQQPICYLINALLNLNLDDKKSNVFPKWDQNTNAAHLIELLDKSIIAYTETELDQTAAPLVTLIRRIYEFAPDSVKKYMQWLLLPTEDDRKKPLGHTDTLSSRLLNLSTAAMLPNLRSQISSMLFELSDKDASTFVHNVGYGFASGFLLSHNIAIPENAMEAFANGNGTTENADEEEKDKAKEKAKAFNPITGQRWDAEEVKDTGPPMTDAEKEREAERLFVLFERLKATGVVNVKNPVEEAIQSGRIEELSDSDEPPSPD